MLNRGFVPPVDLFSWKKALLVVMVLCSGSLAAQENVRGPSIHFDFPLTDLTYQLNATKATGNFLTSYVHPSMAQSLAMSNNFFTLVGFGIDNLVSIDKGIIDVLLENTLSGLFVLFLQNGFPFGFTWMHEEYHKAVLARRGFDSFNEVYYFPFFSSVVKVSHVKDEDLQTLADQYSADFVRLNSAGAESQIHQVQTLQQNSFFYDQSLPLVPLYWISIFGSYGYIQSCTNQSEWDDKKDLTDEPEIRQRDFTGPDFTAWVRELFNPSLPYAARGTHPSGVGINRYLFPKDLSEHEKYYLLATSYRHLFNFVSPFMFGIRHLSFGEHRVNFAFRHLLTSFGDDISLDVYYKNTENRLGMVVSPHIYSNYTTTFFGLELNLVDYPVLDKNFLLSGRMMLWTQPKNQSFTTTEHSLGGLLGLKMTYIVDIWEPYLAVEAKTGGWVMGNVFLEEDVSARLGLVIRFK